MQEKVIKTYASDTVRITRDGPDDFLKILQSHTRFLFGEVSDSGECSVCMSESQDWTPDLVAVFETEEGECIEQK